MGGFILGLLVGSGLSLWIAYRFYHRNVIADLKNIINELEAKMKAAAK